MNPFNPKRKILWDNPKVPIKEHEEFIIGSFNAFDIVPQKQQPEYSEASYFGKIVSVSHRYTIKNNLYIKYFIEVPSHVYPLIVWEPQKFMFFDVGDQVSFKGFWKSYKGFSYIEPYLLQKVG